MCDEAFLTPCDVCGSFKILSLWHSSKDVAVKVVVCVDCTSKLFGDVSMLVPRRKSKWEDCTVYSEDDSSFQATMQIAPDVELHHPNPMERIVVRFKEFLIFK